VFRPRQLSGMKVEGFEALKCTFYRLRSRMDISLAYGHAAVPCDPHDCKRICTRLAQSGQHSVAKGVQNEFAGEPNITLAFDDRASDFGVYVIERGHQQNATRHLPRRRPRTRRVPSFDALRACSGLWQSGEWCALHLRLSVSHPQIAENSLSNRLQIDVAQF
jgi:hypothetical protein